MAKKMGLSLKAALTLSYSVIINGLTIEKRAGTIPAKLPGTWVSQGCYSDNGGTRALTLGGTTSDTKMTIESCISYCTGIGATFAGVEYSSQCYCGLSLTSGSVPIASSSCSMTCSGDATEPCGGPGALNLFWSGSQGPQTNPGVGLWAFSGCYNEGTTGRALTYGATTTGGSGAMTVALCLSACKTAGYVLAGVEYAGECYCGNSIANGGALSSGGLASCNKLCNGNSSEYCGGAGTLDVYDYNKAVTLPPYTTVSSSTAKTSAKSSSSTKVSTSSIKSSSSVKVSTTSVKTSTSKSSIKSTSSTVRTSSSSKSSIKTTASSSTVRTSTSKSSIKTTSSSIKPSSVSTSKKTSLTSTRSTSSTKLGSTSSKGSTSTGKPSSTSSVKISLTSTRTSATPSATLGIKPTVGGYKFQGCFTEATTGRALSGAAFFDDAAMTLEECANSCAGWDYFGVEYGSECYCGNSLNAGSVLANAADCSFTCPGNNLEYCGAGDRLELYYTNVTTTPTTGSASKTATATVSVSSVAAPTGWTYQGCYAEPAGGRMLMFQFPDDQTGLTHESCIAACAAKGYTLAGMEFGVQCFCDTHIYNGAGLAPNQADCNMACPGNKAEMCGAGNRLNLFSHGTPQVYQAPTPQKTGLPANWKYMGCIQDNIPSAEKDANGNPAVTVTTFPYMAYEDNNNTASRCIATCAEFGFNAAGTEYGTQCFCGDVQNILVASNPSAQPHMSGPQAYTRSAVPQIVDDSKCNAYCSGDGSHYCGSGNLMSYYAWNGTTPMYNWNFPTGKAAGEYSLLIGGVIVPLMTTQSINGKVAFIEKYGSGEPNGTGAYELDLSLTNNYKLAWREMLGMQTDVFCSAGLMLPDKAGRIITVGGWAGESNFGVRMYRPDGSAGVNGTNEWEENPGVLSLQVPRWYPAALMMANGSIAIIGGEIGSNAAEQPTLELLPATGVPDATTTSGYSNTTVYLDFLDRTAPFNLYPFVAVLPSGIFIAYWNEARILNEKTFQTVKTLPNIPGAVNDPTAGRTYQLEGAFALLPQHAPYTANVGVLICGGSTNGAQYSLDNCVTTVPEDPNPTWTIERMPSRRVMPCMAGLPDGTYLILNGAQHGVAGFGLGDNPNYNAVLYDPTKPINSRMSVMANTTVARLYHSEAITLLDGRVLVTGSDPTGDYNAAEVKAEDEWPEEYRVEVFTPPYLLSGLPRPTFTITNKDWAYGQTVTFTVGSNSGNLKVSLLGSVVSTHGNSMGQRTIFPAFSCTGTTCTVTAPPDAHRAPPSWYMMFVLDGPTPAVGQYVRIGGDPAKLGNWPANTPGFTLPGV